MCKAVDQMTERARQEGISYGESKGRLETLRNAVKNAMKAFHVSMEDAMNGLEVPQEDRDLIIKML